MKDFLCKAQHNIMLKDLLLGKWGQTEQKGGKSEDTDPARAPAWNSETEEEGGGRQQVSIQNFTGAQDREKGLEAEAVRHQPDFTLTGKEERKGCECGSLSTSSPVWRTRIQDSWSKIAGQSHWGTLKIESCKHTLPLLLAASGRKQRHEPWLSSPISSSRPFLPHLFSALAVSSVESTAVNFGLRSRIST